MVVWTREKVAQLIELYKLNECLWNYEHKSYKDKEARRKAIEEVCRHLKVSTFEYAKKIHNLRNQFSSEMKKLSLRIEQAGETNPSVRCKWSHFDSLSFLKCVIEPRRSNYNFLSPKRSRLICEDSQTSGINNSNNTAEDLETVRNDIIKPPEDCSMYGMKRADLNHIIREVIEIDERNGQFGVNDVKFLPNNISNNKNNNEADTDHMPSTKAFENRSKTSTHEIQTATTGNSCQLSQSSITDSTPKRNDQWDVFGDLIASELRNLNSDISRKKLKRKIMQALLEVGEEDDKFT